MTQRDNEGDAGKSAITKTIVARRPAVKIDTVRALTSAKDRAILVQGRAVALAAALMNMEVPKVDTIRNASLVDRKAVRVAGWLRLTERWLARLRFARRVWRTKWSKQIRFSRSLAGLRFPRWITGGLWFPTRWVRLIVGIRLARWLRIAG